MPWSTRPIYLITLRGIDVMAATPDFFQDIPVTTPEALAQDSGLYALIDISPDGAVEIEAVNGNGQDCLQLTADIEAGFGGVVERTLKPEAKGDGLANHGAVTAQQHNRTHITF